MNGAESVRGKKRTKRVTKTKYSTPRSVSERKKAPWYSTGVDLYLLIPLLVLVAFGVLMVWSANMYTSVVENSGLFGFVKQAVFVAIGIGIMVFLSKIDYRIYNSLPLALILVGLSAVLLGIVLVIGPDINGAKRWLDLRITTFQPSELAKLAGCLYMACIVTQKPQVRVKALPLLKYCILPMALLCGLTIVEPSMTAAIAIAVPMVVILFLAVEKIKLLIPYIIAAVVAAAGFLIAEPWRLGRLAVLFGKGTEDFQISQSLLAIGSGGIFGKGLGNGIQKYLFLPELENDFIFANIGEETGMIGCLLVLALFSVIIFRGIKNAVNAPDSFGFYYTVGVMVLMGYQMLIHVAVAVGVFPVTGMALPFVSAGGSSIIILFAMMGPILNLSRQVNYKLKIQGG